jgi:hypothetical protein
MTRSFTYCYRYVCHANNTNERFVLRRRSLLDDVNVALFTNLVILLTMTRTFYIPYGESVLYSCVEITALTDTVSFVPSSQVVIVPLGIRDLVARLNVRSAVVFFSHVTPPD